MPAPPPAEAPVSQEGRGAASALAPLRRPLFRDPVPVLFNRLQHRHVVVEGDGSIDETPALRIRA